MSDMILVTGATGFVGSHLCERFHEKLPLLAGVRSAKKPTSSQQIRTYPSISLGDITQPIQLPEDISVSTVIHCAARAHQVHDTASNPLEAFREANVMGLKHMIEATKDRGLKRFIFLSTIKVLGNKSIRPFCEEDIPCPLDDYGQSKLEAEELLIKKAKELDFEWVIVRPPLIYGPKAGGNIARMLDLLKKDWPLPLASIYNQRSMIQIDALCDFLVRCLDQKAANQIFHISDEQDYSTPSFIKLLAKDYQLKPKLFACPTFLLKLAGTFLGKRQEIDRLCDSLQVDSSKARQILNWQYHVK